MDAVTLPPIRYVFTCMGCNHLSASNRRDKLTCSPACRVRAHRNGNAEAIRSVAEHLRVAPAMILRCKAVDALRPDLGDQMSAGKVSLADIEAEVWAALCALIEKQFPTEWQEYRSNGFKHFPAD